MGIDNALLEQMTLDINAALEAKRLMYAQRRALEMDRLMVMFMHQSIDDRKRLERVEKASIIIWIQDNSRLSFFCLSVYIVVSAAMNFTEVIAKALGL